MSSRAAACSLWSTDSDGHLLDATCSSVLDPLCQEAAYLVSYAQPVVFSWRTAGVETATGAGS